MESALVEMIVQRERKAYWESHTVKAQLQTVIRAIKSSNEEFEQWVQI